MNTRIQYAIRSNDTHTNTSRHSRSYSLNTYAHIHPQQTRTHHRTPTNQRQLDVGSHCNTQTVHGKPKHEQTTPPKPQPQPPPSSSSSYCGCSYRRYKLLPSPFRTKHNRTITSKLQPPTQTRELVRKLCPNKFDCTMRFDFDLFNSYSIHNCCLSHSFMLIVISPLTPSCRFSIFRFI